MNNIAGFYNNADMVEKFVVNDSVNDVLPAVDNHFKDFKFVTEQCAKFEGPKERDVTYISAAWNFVVLFVVLILMVLNKFMSPQRLSSVISMPFQNGSSDRTMRDSQSFFTPVSFSTIISSILMLSLFVQKIFIVYGENRILHDNFDFFIDVAICVSTIFVFTYLLTAFYGWMFKTDSLIYFHFTSHVSAMATCNLLLMPIILLLFFHPYKFFLVFTLVILGVFFIITFIKLLIEVRMLSKLNFVNIFLYLCTVEILPILVISKMIVNVL